MTQPTLTISDSSAQPSFGHHLRRLQRDVLLMGALVERSCQLAHEALCDRNLQSAQQLKAHDKQIDKLYRQIEVDCVQLLIHPPQGMQDLRHVSAFMQLIRDLERIGDYATDIGEVAIKLFSTTTYPCAEQIQLMFDRSRSMVALGLQAVSDLNADVGADLRVKDDAVDDDYEAIYRSLISVSPDTTSVETIVLLVLAIRYLERIADHATNIGRRIAYVITGERR